MKKILAVLLCLINFSSPANAGQTTVIIEADGTIRIYDDKDNLPMLRCKGHHVHIGNWIVIYWR